MYAVREDWWSIGMSSIINFNKWRMMTLVKSEQAKVGMLSCDSDSGKMENVNIVNAGAIKEKKENGEVQSTHTTPTAES